jgi:hypothetical protein
VRNEVSGSQAERAISRAVRSMSCLPFKKAFYKELDTVAISSNELCQLADQDRFLFHSLSPDKAEDSFIWMIKLGILRREVDGQGLTSRVRLTPMGREVIQRINAEIPRASRKRRLVERVQRFMNRA